MSWKPSKYVKSVMIFCPAFGQQMHTLTAQSIFNAGQFMTLHGIPNVFTTMSAGDIEELRNLAITSWYDGTEYSHLLMVDADMEFPVALIRDMLGFGKPLVGCFYARRQWPAVAVGRAFDEGSVSDLNQGFLKVAGVGGGVLLIERNVVRVMLDKLSDIVDQDVSGHPGIAHLPKKRLIRAFDKYRSANNDRLSEDLAFCDRWLRCDGEVWANVNHLIGHYGMFNYAIRYADFLEKKAAA